ncbi:MAG: cell division protein FtsA [Alphaproteobacteria bacterium]|nr:cell division protein FtsA [Alphaproteobacteria bacterium]
MTDVYSVLDVGAEKICCLIAAREPGRALTVIGSGQTRSEGFDNGVVTDMYALPTAIRKAVRRAEEMADGQITQVIATLPCAQPTSTHQELPPFQINGGRITEQSFSEMRLDDPSDDDTGTSRIAHALPVRYELDGSRVDDPVDMVGNLLRINVHLVHAERSVGWNLETCLADAQIEVKALVFPALAAGLAVMTEEERRIGSVVIDVGASRISLGIFHEDALVYTWACAGGGDYFTRDLARGLGVSLREATRIKKFHASTVIGEGLGPVLVQPHEAETEDERIEIPAKAVNQIVASRAKAMFEELAEVLASSGFPQEMGGVVVLTGGGSQIRGFADAASKVLARRVRLGRPEGVQGLPEALRKPEFAVLVGLLRYAEDPPREFLSRALPSRAGGLRAAFRWLRENF